MMLLEEAYVVVRSGTYCQGERCICLKVVDGRGHDGLERTFAMAMYTEEVLVAN